ncbi:hypothetical protein ACWCOT_25645 [Nonomuraea bangladeshensis]
MATAFSSVSATPPSPGRTLATAASTTWPTPAGAITVTSTERASAALPNRHTRAPGDTTASSRSATPARVSARSASRAAPDPTANPSRPAAARPPQVTDSAATGLTATATRPPSTDIPLTRTRNRCVSPVRSHVPTPSWTAPTRSSTSETPLAATGTAGTAARITTPASIQPRRIVQLPRCDT